MSTHNICICGEIRNSQYFFLVEILIIFLSALMISHKLYCQVIYINLFLLYKPVLVLKYIGISIYWYMLYKFMCQIC